MRIAGNGLKSALRNPQSTILKGQAQPDGAIDLGHSLECQDPDPAPQPALRYRKNLLRLHIGGLKKPVIVYRHPQHVTGCDSDVLGHRPMGGGEGGDNRGRRLLIADVVLDDERRAHSCLLAAAGRIEVHPVEFASSWKRHVVRAPPLGLGARVPRTPRFPQTSTRNRAPVPPRGFADGTPGSTDRRCGPATCLWRAPALPATPLPPWQSSCSIWPCLPGAWNGLRVSFWTQLYHISQVITHPPGSSVGIFAAGI